MLFLPNLKNMLVIIVLIFGILKHVSSENELLFTLWVHNCISKSLSKTISSPTANAQKDRYLCSQGPDSQDADSRAKLNKSDVLTSDFKSGMRIQRSFNCLNFISSFGIQYFVSRDNIGNRIKNVRLGVMSLMTL